MWDHTRARGQKVIVELSQSPALRFLLRGKDGAARTTYPRNGGWYNVGADMTFMYECPQARVLRKVIKCLMGFSTPEFANPKLPVSSPPSRNLEAYAWENAKM